MATASRSLRQVVVVGVRRKKICLVTSSNSKRRVFPNSLITRGHSATETALRKVWEDAGLVGVLAPEPVGIYRYRKLSRNYHVSVYVLRVTEAANNWPKKNLRKRAWVNVERALKQLDEASLRERVRRVIRGHDRQSDG
jgi:ADP-ribose pyrophosphatase YjhB (NUDIX family)